ncbi:hypothetical protein BB558_006181 [Smittium angustum]|uniref:Exocyst complex component Sec10-like alpha-helical bundle domain-containing protein n=1 Tax=Smittium angustum TaxID=133377 RepID=A0A2U1IYG8_SMIAN|nr:hypothetical protein BB558_006181 [Smittium angustum]
MINFGTTSKHRVLKNKDSSEKDDLVQAKNELNNSKSTLNNLEENPRQSYTIKSSHQYQLPTNETATINNLRISKILEFKKVIEKTKTVTNEIGSGLRAGPNQVMSLFEKLKTTQLSKLKNSKKTAENNAVAQKYKDLWKKNLTNNSSNGRFDWLSGKEADHEWWMETPVVERQLDSFEFTESYQVSYSSSDEETSQRSEEIRTPQKSIEKHNKTSFSIQPPKNIKSTRKNSLLQKSTGNLIQNEPGHSLSDINNQNDFSYKTDFLSAQYPKGPKLNNWARLPPRILANLSRFLSLKDSLTLLSIRYYWHSVFIKKDACYGPIFWRLMLGRIGFRCSNIRIKGKEQKILWNSPNCLWSLLRDSWDIRNEQDLTNIINEGPFILFESIHKEFISDYENVGYESSSIEKMFLKAITSNRNTFALKYAERLEQLLWFGRGNFHSKSENINKKLLQMSFEFENYFLSRIELAVENKDFFESQKYSEAIFRFNNGRAYVNRYLEENTLAFQTDYDDIITFEEIDARIGIKEQNPLENMRALVLSKSSITKTSSDFEDLFELLTQLLEVELEEQIKILGASKNSNLIKITIGNLLYAIFQPDGIIGRAFSRTFDYQAEMSSNGVTFLTSISDILKIMLRHVEQWSKPSSLYLVKTRLENYLPEIANDLEKTNLNRGWLAAISWFDNGMPAILQSAESANEQFIFFTSNVYDIINNRSLRFKSATAPTMVRKTSENKKSPLISSTENKPNYIGNPSITRFMNSTKPIKLFNFTEHSEQIEMYKTRISNYFMNIMGIIPGSTASKIPTALNSDINSDKLEVKNEGSDQGLQISTLVDISPSNLDPKTTETFGEHKGASFDSEISETTNFPDFVPINVPLCISMLAFTDEAISRIFLFCKAPEFSHVHKSSKKVVEQIFSGLLRNIGSKHIKTAFENIILDLQKLQTQIGTLSGLITAAKTAGNKKANVSKKSSTINNSDEKEQGFEKNGDDFLSKKSGQSFFPKFGSINKRDSISGISTAMKNNFLANSSFSSVSFDLSISTNEIMLERQVRELVSILELKFFELVHLADLVMQLIEVYYKAKISKLIDENDFLNIVNLEKRSLEATIDDCVATGVDSIIEIIIRQLEHVLSVEQKAEDYLPKTNVSLQLKPTIACVQCVQLLGEASEIIKNLSRTQKLLCQVYMSEIGNRLFTLLLDHIRSYTYSEPGGFQLIADLNLYYDWAQNNLDDLDTLQCFATLKDLANCFIINPKELRGFLKELYSRRAFDNVLRSEEVYDIVARRADYKKIRGMVEGHCDFM